MGGGRKNLKRAVEDNSLTLKHGQCIMQVLSLQGSNQIGVMDAKGEKSLAFFPAKFQKSMWMKRGSFVVVDESGREEALESGSKVTCIVTQVLFHEQVKRLQKGSEWPEAFKSQTHDSSTQNLSGLGCEQETEETGSSDDDGLPPLETNMNRRRPCELHAGSSSNSDADTDTDEES
ncbi:uncharacterized protein LOC130797617 [Amaranthus tricolor]|uniref:uncharacterized protein LOC130797617 n=1 Tax=Amaranthus tricolor TaxID=29722 RepID=UPI002585930E|nr:uncharacterized protein LOC130797617 [Amaranthus tricolor]XP_057516259.1 uncharacterized protein LOC130797617 [Amaranthus tricolor]